MNLILHLVKKDFRQTWMWILAVSLSLAGLCWSAYMNFHAPPADRNLWANALVGLAAATLVSTAVFLAMLVHSESLCGARAHWLGRPIDWRYLLAAKSLLATAATALPLVFGMAVYLAAEGFPPTEHLPAIARRTAPSHWKVASVTSVGGRIGSGSHPPVEKPTPPSCWNHASRWKA